MRVVRTVVELAVERRRDGDVGSGRDPRREGEAEGEDAREEPREEREADEARVEAVLHLSPQVVGRPPKVDGADEGDLAEQLEGVEDPEGGCAAGIGSERASQIGPGGEKCSLLSAWCHA